MILLYGILPIKQDLIYLFTINACITPGNQANRVSNKLTKNVVPIPCFMNTAKGGKRIFKIIVNSDIVYVFR